MWTIIRGIFVLMMIIFVRGNEGESYRRIGRKKFAWKTLIVDKNGHGNFSTIQAAIDSVPSDNRFWVSIHIRPGLYRYLLLYNFEFFFP